MLGPTWFSWVATKNEKRSKNVIRGSWPLIAIYESQITSKQHTRRDTAENPQIMVMPGHE